MIPFALKVARRLDDDDNGVRNLGVALGALVVRLMEEQEEEDDGEVIAEAQWTYL